MNSKHVPPIKVVGYIGLLRAAITKLDRMSGLNNINLFADISGGCKYKINMLAGLVSCMAWVLIL